MTAAFPRRRGVRGRREGGLEAGQEAHAARVEAAVAVAFGVSSVVGVCMVVVLSPVRLIGAGALKPRGMLPEPRIRLVCSDAAGARDW